MKDERGPLKNKWYLSYEYKNDTVYDGHVIKHRKRNERIRRFK